MSHRAPSADTESPTRDDQSSPSLDDRLNEICEELASGDSEILEELGRYSIYENSSSRMLTVPVNAKRFDLVSQVKQFYVDGEQPMLIILPLTC